MEKRSNNAVPFKATHPGEILREELKERGIKQKDFANAIGVQASHLNEFIKGKRDLNNEFALKLEKHLGIPFEMWANLQKNYEIDCKAIEARASEQEEALAYENQLASLLNLSALYKHLNIEKNNVVQLMKQFPFNLLELPQMELQVAGLYKHSEKVQIDEKNMRTWLVINWHTISQTSINHSYTNGNALLAAKEIAKYANNSSLSIEKIREILNSFGIAYIHVPKLEKTPIDAYSTISHQMPVITVTYRYNDLDKLAFDILHELCHIDRHLSEDGRSFISVEGVEYSNDPRELEANEFAREMLIPKEIWNQILKVGCKNLAPISIAKTIGLEAKKRNISPSVAVARYKFESNNYRIPMYHSPKLR